MTSDGALRSRRSRKHKAGDHTLCQPGCGTRRGGRAAGYAKPAPTCVRCAQPRERRNTSGLCRTCYIDAGCPRPTLSPRPPPRVCACGTRLSVNNKSGRCRDCYNTDRHVDPPERICPGCDHPFTATQTGRSKGDGSGWTATCSKSCAFKIRIAAGLIDPAQGRPPSNPERERTRYLASARKRRMHLAALPWDGVTDRAILERDQWRCGICHEPIDQTLTYPHPASGSVDHITPLSRGGGDTQWNKQAAHLACNQAKGDGRHGDQLVLPFGSVTSLPRPEFRPCPDCGAPLNTRAKRCHRHTRVRWCDACGGVIPGRKRCACTRVRPPKPEPRRCRVGECTNPGNFGAGCCAPHYHRLNRHGDVFADIPLARDYSERREAARQIRARLAA